MSTTELAVTSLKTGDSPFRGFTIERAYSDVANHVKFDRLTIVHIDRLPSIENNDDFANGNEADARGVIFSTIYWLIGNVRCTIKCVNEYDYHISERGVEANLCSTKIKFERDDGCVMSMNEFQIIRGCGKLASSTTHKDIVGICETIEAEIPRCFINAIVQECALENSLSYIPVLKTYEELLADEEAAKAVAASKIAEETRVRREKTALEKQKFIALLQK